MTRIRRQGRPRNPHLLSTAMAIALVTAFTVTAIVATLLSTVAMADEGDRPPIQVETACRFDVSLGQGGRQIPGMEFDLFRIGNISADAEVTLDPRFAGTLPEGDISEMRISASAINEIVSRCQGAGGDVTSWSGITDERGELSFGDGSGVPVGIYVVIGHELVTDEGTYRTLPFVTWLPQWDEETGMWSYWVIASPKPEFESRSGIQGGGGEQGGDEGDADTRQSPASGQPGKSAVGRTEWDISQLIATGGAIPVIAGLVLLASTVIEVALQIRKRKLGG